MTGLAIPDHRPIFAGPASPKHAVFTTSDIQRRAWANEEPHVFDADGGGWRSTGKLEAALRDGFDVWVMTSRPELGEHDDWWLLLVGAAVLGYREGDAVQASMLDVLRTRGRSRVRNSGATSAKCEVAAVAWRRFVWETLKVPMRISITDEWQDIEARLPEYGVRLGRSFRP